ncbi:Resolvase [uncultured virus]|nr:Resolvase [uncultured virus]
MYNERAETKGVTNVFGYARVSTKNQRETGMSVELQMKEIKDHCAATSNLNLHYIYVDDGISATSEVTDRPALNWLMEMLERGDKVVVSNLDRWCRDGVQAIKLNHSLKSKGVTFRSLAMEEDSEAYATSEVMLGVMDVAFKKARQFNEEKKELLEELSSKDEEISALQCEIVRLKAVAMKLRGDLATVKSVPESGVTA